MSATFDLSNLGLSAGAYDITAIAKAKGYLDSTESAAVNYYNNSIVGTWVFNDVISADGLRTYNNNSTSGVKYKFTFTIQGSTKKYTYMDYNTLYSRAAIGGGDSSSGTNFYYFYDADGNENYWASTNYKTWTITSELKVGVGKVTEEIAQEFKTWLKANATKQ